MCRRAKENHKERGTDNALQETNFHYLCMKTVLGNSKWKIKNHRNIRTEEVLCGSCVQLHI
jgi:hypothetical protein